VRTGSLLLVIMAGLALGLAGYSSARAESVSGADADARAGMTILHRAAEQGDVTEMEKRIAAGDSVDARDERGLTPLHRAVIVGQLKIAGLLLDHGANPNALAEGEMTPLHFAAMLARPEIAGLLTRRGARTDVRNASGLMPLHLAANDKVVKVLAEAGADVNALTSKGLTPMHTARHGLVAKELVRQKADLRIRSPKGRTPLDTAGIETFERHGLSIHSIMLGRLRGIMGQMPVTLTNVSDHAMRDLAIAARSPGCSIQVTPESVAQVLPGQNAEYILTLFRDVDAPEGDHPVFLSLSLDGKVLGETDLKVDTRNIVTPEDQGMIRLAKGQIRPAAPRWHYFIYAAAPILVVGLWLFFRRRKQ
jgi:hypothetical protein